MQTHTWDQIDRDVRLGLFLIVANAQEALGANEPAALAFAKAVFGDKLPGDENISYHINELDDLEPYNVEHTRFWKAARDCFDFVHDTDTALDAIHVDDFEAEHFRWLHQFLCSIPSDSYATNLGVHHYMFNVNSTEYALPQLLAATSAKMEFVRVIDCGLGVGEYDLGMSPSDLAHLAEMSLTSVRNCIGPAGSNRPIKSRPNNTKEVYADTLDALEWLAGRRNYRMPRLSPSWLTEPSSRLAVLPNANEPIHFARPDTAGQAIGVYAWVNKITTEELARTSGLPIEAVRTWTRGDISAGVEHAKLLATALEVDVEKYVAAIAALASAEPAAASHR